MERDSIIYKARRKCQVLASYIIPDKTLCKIYSKTVMKKNVDLDNPKTINEKIQWLKIYEYPYNNLVVKCADKYRVREYIESKGLKSLLVPLLGDWEKAKDIDFDKLPNKFVLKCNHGCAYNIVCDNKKELDIKKTVRTLNRWMREDFGRFNIEKHYSKIKPHIICEKYLGDGITDYKFFCFNGKPECLYVSCDLIHDRQAKIGFYDIKGKKLPFVRDDYADLVIDKFPKYYEEMKKTAEMLCKDFEFVRVDFFALKDRYYFSELTFTPGGGMMSFNPESYDEKFGKLLNIENLVSKKTKNSVL